MFLGVKRADKRRNRWRRPWSLRGAVKYPGRVLQHNAPIVRERTEGLEDLSEFPRPVTVVPKRPDVIAETPSFVRMRSSSPHHKEIPGQVRMHAKIPSCEDMGSPYGKHRTQRRPEQNDDRSWRSRWLRERKTLARERCGLPRLLPLGGAAFGSLIGWCRLSFTFGWWRGVLPPFGPGLTGTALGQT